jgi:hypothetical protein
MSETRDQRKALRQKRQKQIARAYRNSRGHMEVIKRIGVELGGGPLTVPELSEVTGLPSPEVLWHLMAMKRYGMVNEHAKDGDYFRYAVAAPAAADDA